MLAGKKHFKSQMMIYSSWEWSYKCIYGRESKINWHESM